MAVWSQGLAMGRLTWSPCFPPLLIVGTVALAVEVGIYLQIVELLRAQVLPATALVAGCAERASPPWLQVRIAAAKQ